LLASIATVQIVLTVTLLTGAALMIRTSMKLASINPGFSTVPMNFNGIGGIGGGNGSGGGPIGTEGFADCGDTGGGGGVPLTGMVAIIEFVGRRSRTVSFPSVRSPLITSP
jgi:hypothetical protein